MAPVRVLAIAGAAALASVALWAAVLGPAVVMALGWGQGPGLVVLGLVIGGGLAGAAVLFFRVGRDPERPSSPRREG